MEEANISERDNENVVESKCLVKTVHNRVPDSQGMTTCVMRSSDFRVLS